MINVPFDDQQFSRLERLLELEPGEHPDADTLLAALADAVEVSLTLSRGSSSRRDPLVADAEKRARAASTRMP